MPIKDFRLPDLGEGLEDGEIVEWHVEEGEEVTLNQPVVSVETAKAVVEIPAPFAGRVVERVGAIGETVGVGTVFLRIDVPSEVGDTADPTADLPASDDAEPQPLVGYGQGNGRRRRRRRGQPAPPTPATPAQGDDEPSPSRTEARPVQEPEGEPARSAAATARALAKPPVRKLAKDLGVDLAALAPGSGPHGTITRDDVRDAATRVAAPDSGTTTAAGDDRSDAGREVGGSVPGFRGRRPGEVEPVRGIRKRIVEKMERAHREIPDATCSRDADLTELWDLREVLTAQARDEGVDVKITPFVLVMRATVLGLRRFPTLNSRIDREAGEIHLFEHIDLGFAADTDRGLVVPTIRDAHRRSLLELALDLNRLAAAARDGSIRPDELTGGTFTVNNYGSYGNDQADPIINHPESAILGLGAIRERPWVVDGEIAVRRVARFTLAFDHRVCDGGEAGRFVTYVADLCERPGRLLLHA